MRTRWEIGNASLKQKYDPNGYMPELNFERRPVFDWKPPSSLQSAALNEEIPFVASWLDRIPGGRLGATAGVALIGIGGWIAYRHHRSKQSQTAQHTQESDLNR